MEPEELIAAGRHAEAAQRLRERGELGRAQSLLESIWDFSGAAEIARQRGEVVDELRLRLEAGESARAMQLVDLLTQLPVPDQERAGTVLIARQMHVEAALLAESRGALAEAERLYHLAQRPLEEAAVATRRGDLRRAGVLFESALEIGSPAEQLRARLGLAQIHLQLGRPWEAVALCQRAQASNNAERSAILRLMVLAFYGGPGSLGLEHAARAVYERVPDRPATFEDLLDEERARAARLAPELVAGRYRVLRYLGAGTTGRAYLAHDELVDRHVALKLVPPPIDPRLALGFQSFLREVKILYHLRHPNIVEIYDVDEKNGLLVVEFLDGGSLADRPLPLPPLALRRVLSDLLRGLAAVHAEGVVHRDIKPANLLLAPSGACKLADFGAAHVRSLAATQTAGFVGSLGYMSPEQIRGETPTFAADLYGVGCTAFQLLTGRLPFVGPDFSAQHLGTPAPRPSDVDPALARWDAWMARALAKRPEQRPESAAAMLAALDPIWEEPFVVGAGPREASAEPSMTRFSERTERWQRLEVTIAPHGELWRVLDRQLHRELEVERVPTDALPERIAWLRLVADVGPAVQRIVRLDPEGPFFEALPRLAATRALTAEERRELSGALTRLWAAGHVHGALAESIVFTPSGPVLRLAGAPATGATVEEERALLA